MVQPDPFEPMRRQQEQIRRALQPHVLKALEEHQRRMTAAIQPPALRQMQLLQKRLQDLIDPPVIRAFREQQERIARLVESPALRAISEQRERWEELLTPRYFEQVEAFRTQLVASMTAAAEEAAAAAEDEVPEVWFGAASWSALLNQIEGLLKALELMTAGMAASKSELDAPIPGAILAVLVMLILAAELALWAAKGSQENDA